MITRAAAGDAPRLARLHAEAFERPWTARELALLMAQPGTAALMATEGFILVRRAAAEAEVLTLAVLPAARRRGLGRSLVEAAADALVREGVSELRLEAAHDNAAALALYAAAGFEPVGRRPRYYARPPGPAADAVVMLRRLNTPAA